MTILDLVGLPLMGSGEDTMGSSLKLSKTNSEFTPGDKPASNPFGLGFGLFSCLIFFLVLGRWYHFLCFVAR